MLFLASTPDIAPITDLINTWIHIGQALVGSVGALAFIFCVGVDVINTGVSVGDRLPRTGHYRST
jgi:hypothetical protein